MSKKCSFCGEVVYRNNLNRIKERKYTTTGNETVVLFTIFCNEDCKNKYEVNQDVSNK